MDNNEIFNRLASDQIDRHELFGDDCVQRIRQTGIFSQIEEEVMTNDIKRRAATFKNHFLLTGSPNTTDAMAEFAAAVIIEVEDRNKALLSQLAGVVQERDELIDQVAGAVQERDELRALVDRAIAILGGEGDHKSGRSRLIQLILVRLDGARAAAKLDNVKALADQEGPVIDGTTDDLVNQARNPYLQALVGVVDAVMGKDRDPYIVSQVPVLVCQVLTDKDTRISYLEKRIEDLKALPDSGQDHYV